MRLTRKKDWLIREPDAADRRANRLVLTENGKKMYLQALTSIRSGYEYMLKRTPSDELNKALPFLEKVYGDLKTLLESEKK